MRHTFLTVLLAGAASLSVQAQQGPTDPQIAHIVVTANQVDIEAGKLAEKSGSTPDVKAFGKQMVTDHTAVNKQATELVQKLKVTPEANATSASLKKGGDENLGLDGFGQMPDEPRGQDPPLLLCLGKARERDHRCAATAVGWQ